MTYSLCIFFTCTFFTIILISTAYALDYLPGILGEIADEANFVRKFIYWRKHIRNGKDFISFEDFHNNKYR